MTESSTHGTASNALARLAEDGLLVKTGYARTRIPEIHRRPAPGAGGAAPEAGSGRPRRHAGARARDQGGFDAGAGGGGGICTAQLVAPYSGGGGGARDKGPANTLKRTL